MSKRHHNLRLTSPRCIHCGAPWQPAESVDALATYCPNCADERRAAAQAHFQLKPLCAADFVGGYLLPRHLRTVAG